MNGLDQQKSALKILSKRGSKENKVNFQYYLLWQMSAFSFVFKCHFASSGFEKKEGISKVREQKPQ